MIIEVDADVVGCGSCRALADDDVEVEDPLN